MPFFFVFPTKKIGFCSSLFTGFRNQKINIYEGPYRTCREFFNLHLLALVKTVGMYTDASDVSV